jgi:hypothetical protein
METKLFEVRDRMTFIPAICIKLSSENEEERYLIAMAGYGLRADQQGQIILMGRLGDVKLKANCNEHQGYPVVRTMWLAHQHIQKHWNEFESGDVLDVEFIMGETTVPKISQRLENVEEK